MPPHAADSAANAPVAGLRRRRLGALLPAFIPALLPAAVAGCAGPASRRAGDTDSDVLVLGAGLAGLHSARLLRARGLRVTVLEALPRVGGRLWTLDDLPGSPETGGQQIGTAYTRTVATARELGLVLQPSARSPLLRDERLVLFIHNRRQTLAQWGAASDNPFQEGLRALPPDRALPRLMAPNPLPGLAAWRAASSASFDGPLDTALRQRGVNEAALRLLDVNNALGDTLASTSLLNLHYSQANIADLQRAGGPVSNISGGNQRLPEAMARALQGAGGEVHLGDAVLALEQHATGAMAHSASGRRHRARFVVCTLPLPALARVRATPAWPAPFARALQDIPYGRVTQLHLQVLRPFWEEDQSAPYLWSDGPLERLFPQDRAGDGRPATLIAWINGAGTAAWDGLDEAACAARVQAELLRVWPNAAGAVRLLRRVSWQQMPGFGGSWINWAPGHIGAYAALLLQAQGRVHFAGEHTGTGFRGIEAAMESAERAAAEVLARA